MLSLGCGIGDTELLLAPRVGQVIGMDLSPAAVRQACADAERLGVMNATFLEGTEPRSGERFDAVISIFLLHHLPEPTLREFPACVFEMLKAGGVFYSLDPSNRRLSGAVGRRLIPKLMKKYQTPDERELAPEATAQLFRGAGFNVQSGMYDFGSTPLAGLLPGSRVAYWAGRRTDDLLLLFPPLRRRGSNFEIIATKP